MHFLLWSRAINYIALARPPWLFRTNWDFQTGKSRIPFSVFTTLIANIYQSTGLSEFRLKKTDLALNPCRKRGKGNQSERSKKRTRHLEAIKNLREKPEVKKLFYVFIVSPKMKALVQKKRIYITSLKAKSHAWLKSASERLHIQGIIV